MYSAFRRERYSTMSLFRHEGTVMNRVLRGSVVLAAAVAALLSCKGDPTDSLRNGVVKLIATPSVLFIPEGASQNVVVEAVDAQGNQAGTEFNLPAAQIGTGISVVVDPTFNPVYAGETLTRPGTVTRARYIVTANQQVSTTFVVTAGGHDITIPVGTQPTTAAATFAPANLNVGDTLTVTAPSSMKFTGSAVAANRSTVTFAAGPCAVVPGSLAPADSSSLKCIPFPGSNGDATLTHMRTTYSTPGDYTVTAVSGVTVPAAPVLALAPASPIAGDTITVTLTGPYRFTPGSAPIIPGVRTAKAVLSADSLTLKFFVGPDAAGPVRIDQVRLTGRAIVDTFDLFTAPVNTGTVPAMASSTGTANFGDAITVTLSTGRYRFIPTSKITVARDAGSPFNVVTATTGVSADSLTLTYQIGANANGLASTDSSVVLSGAAALGRFFIASDSTMVTPLLTQFPATVSPAFPTLGQLVTITPSGGFTFGASPAVTTGTGTSFAPGPGVVTTANATSLSFRPLQETGKSKPVVTKVINGAFSTLPLTLFAGGYVTTPSALGQQTLATTANSVFNIPATGVSTILYEPGTTFGTNDCFNINGPFFCRWYRIEVAGPRTFDLTTAWGGTQDLGFYFFDETGNPFETSATFFDCDNFGSGAGGQPEACTKDLPAAGIYYMSVVNFSASDPSTITMTFTGQ
jgi:hypothetical protein